MAATRGESRGVRVFLEVRSRRRNFTSTQCRSSQPDLTFRLAKVTTAAVAARADGSQQVRLCSCAIDSLVYQILKDQLFLEQPVRYVAACNALANKALPGIFDVGIAQQATVPIGTITGPYRVNPRISFMHSISNAFESKQLCG